MEAAEKKAKCIISCLLECFLKDSFGEKMVQKVAPFFALCKAGPFPIISEKILFPSAQPNPPKKRKLFLIVHSPAAARGFFSFSFDGSSSSWKKDEKRQKWFNSASLLFSLFLYRKCVGGCVFSLSFFWGVLFLGDGMEDQEAKFWKWKERKGSPNICLVRTKIEREEQKAKEVIDDWNRGGRRKPRGWKMKIKRFPSKTNNRNLLLALPRSVFPFSSEY